MKRLLVAALLLGAAAPSNPAATPLSRDNLPGWHHRHEEKLARVRQGHVDLVFLGDSITEDWEKRGPPAWRDFVPSWQRFYGDRNAVNLGFSGDTTASLLWRIQNGEVDGIKPKAAVVLIGANNFGLVHWSAEQTLGGIEAIIAEVRRRLPGTRILLMSVLPSERSERVTQLTRQVNQSLAGRYGNGVSYVDVTSVFEHDGRIDRDAFLDGFLSPPGPLLHPNAFAQAKMSEAIEPTLAQLMGDAVHR